MWRKGKKWLALVLAFTLSFGDFLPAVAAAPEAVTEAAAEAEVTEVPADEQEAVTEEPDAETPEEVPEETAKEPEQAEEGTVEAEPEITGSEAEPEDLQVESDVYEIAEGTVIPAKDGYWEFIGVPKTTAYYALSDGTELQVYEAETYRSVEEIPVVSGDKVIKYLKLTKGVKYQIAVLDYYGVTEHTFASVQKMPSYPTLNANGGSFKLAAGKAACYKFPAKTQKLVLSSDQNSDIDRTGDVFSNRTVTVNGIVWHQFVCYSDNQTGYVLIGASDQEQTITYKKDFTYETLSDWSGEYTLAPGEAKFVEYDANEIGDYLIRGSVTCQMIQGQWEMNNGMSIGDVMYNYTSIYNNDSTKILTVIQNDTSENQKITFLRETEMPTQEMKIGNNSPGTGETTYYKFTASEKGFYRIEAYYDWILKNGSHDKNRNEDIQNPGGLFLDKGESILLRANSWQSETELRKIEFTEVRGSKLVLGSDWGTWTYAFTPAKSGVYYAGGDIYSVQMWNENAAGNSSWENWSQDSKNGNRPYASLEAGKTYYLVISGGNGAISRSKSITVLDYDYYQAFTASGGSVSIGADGTVTLTGGKAGTVLNRIKALTKNVLSVAGVQTYSSAYADDFAAANQYWKGKAGAFQAEGFYKINVDGSLTEVTGQEVTDDDETLVVRYAPEVVWVESMTITTEDNTTLPAGEELQLTANPKAATEKYGFRQAPQIRWESSDPEIADVDQNGLVTTYQPGNVTITAYADEDLRDYYRRQGMKMQAYTAASISLNVIKGEEALTGLKVTPESTELVLSRESNGAGGYVDGHASSYATVEAVPSSVMLESKYVYWSIYRKGDPKDKKDCVITGDSRSATFTVHKSGDYTIEVTCYKDAWSDTPLASGTADIHVTAGKDPFPLAQGLGAYAFRNVDGVMTFGNYEKALDEQVANGKTDYTGTFVYTDLKLNELQSTTKLSVGTNIWLVTYVPGENDNYSESMSYVTVEYGDLDVRLSSSAGTTLSATIQGGAATTATAYENKTGLITELWCNGEKLDPELFTDCGYTVGTKTFTTKKKDILSVNAAKGEVTGLKAGTDTLNVTIPIIAADIEGKVTTAFFKKTLNFTVKDESARAVKTIEIWNKADEKQKFENGSQTMISANKTEAQTIALRVSVKDFAGVDYSTAKLTWKTSDKSVASVAAAKDGSVTLTIPKGATGAAEITATANDYNKASTTFRLVVLDSDVRVVNSTITVNSKSEEYAKLQLMPNTLWAEAMGISEENLRMEVSTINVDDKLEFDGDDGEVYGKLFDMEDGTIGLRYKDPNEKAGTAEFTLIVFTYDADTSESEALVLTEVEIKVVNKPSIPKTTAKVTSNYNTFWKNENSYAEVLLTAGADVANIALENNDYYEIADTEKVNSNTNQWNVTLKAKNGVAPKKSPVVFDVTYTDYRETAPVKTTVNVVNQKPSLAITTADNVTTFYPELGERTSIIVLQTADGVTAKDIELTAAASKNFQITRILQEPSQDNEYYAAIEVTSLTGKTADVEFTVKSSQFAQAGASVVSKKLRLTAKKPSAEKPVIYNTTTGEIKTSYTLQQALAGKETLKLNGMWEDCNYSRYYFRTSVDGGDKFTEQMLQAGYLKLEKTKYDGYMIQATPTLFEKGSSCKLKFTFYATAYNGDQKYHMMKSVVINLKLQKQKQAAPISVKLTARGSLNVVDRMSYTYLMPTFKNLPQGAWVESVEFTDIEHAMRYQISDNMDGRIMIWVNPDLGGMPIGKDKVDLVYNIVQSDGTRVTVPATVTINLTQTATVKADKKSVTLYNTATGEKYGSTVTLELGKVTRANISSIDVTGLDGSGISCAKDAENGKLCFYVDPAAQRGTAKNYNVKLTVHLKNAGAKNGKEVTYTVPVTVTLKK